MQDAYFIDPHFDYENSTQSILSIRYATDGFSFCVHDAKDKLMVFYHQTYPVDTLETAFHKIKNDVVNNAVLKLQYQRVYLLSCGQEKTLLPTPFFKEQHLPLLCALNQHITKDDRLIYHYLSPIDAYLTESVPNEFADFLEESYPGIQIVNCAYSFIYSAISKTLPNTEQLFIHIEDQYFDLLLFQDSRLKLFTTFSYQTETDIIYYILNCLKECKVEKEKVNVSLSGLLIHSVKLKELLGIYLSNLFYVQEPLLNALLKNKAFNSSLVIHLLNLHRCGL